MILTEQDLKDLSSSRTCIVFTNHILNLLEVPKPLKHGWTRRLLLRPVPKFAEEEIHSMLVEKRSRNVGCNIPKWFYGNEEF